HRTDGDPDIVAGDFVEFGGVDRIADHEPRPPSADPIDEVGRPDRCRRWRDHRAELRDRKHRLPQLDLIAEHDDHRVAIGKTARSYCPRIARSWSRAAR